MSYPVELWCLIASGSGLYFHSYLDHISILPLLLITTYSFLVCSSSATWLLHLLGYRPLWCWREEKRWNFCLNAANIPCQCFLVDKAISHFCILMICVLVHGDRAVSIIDPSKGLHQPLFPLYREKNAFPTSEGCLLFRRWLVNGLFQCSFQACSGADCLPGTLASGMC